MAKRKLSLLEGIDPLTTKKKKGGNMRLPIYSSAEEERWNSANHSVLWGWKRDEDAYQRVILFKGTIDRAVDGTIQLEDWFFYYRNRCNPEDAQIIKSYFETEEVLCNIGLPSCSFDKKSGLQIVEIQGGADRNNSRIILRRLLNRRKRRNMPRGEFPSPCENAFDFKAHRPIAFYVGSGLSYEAGLMTLAEVHERFGVDNISKKCFTFGLDDPIPRSLNNSVKKTFAEFVSLHVAAAEREPSKSHQAIAKIISESIAVRLLTDNVDNLFNQLNLEFIRTRGIGVFNDPHKVLFDRNEKTLLVGGVAADRRSIIKQARQQGLKIVVVNPHLPVSPNSQNLSYMKSTDIWYKMTMEDFFRSTGYLE